MTRRRIIEIVGLLALLALPPAAEAWGNPFLTTQAGRMLTFAIAAVSLDLLVGYGGMVSLGHAAFFGLGAYTVGILTHHSFEGSEIPFLPFGWEGTTSALIQWPLAMLTSALFALFIGALSLRTQGIFFIMITLAFAQMIFFLMISLPTYGGEDGLNLWMMSEVPGLDLGNDTTLYYVTLASLFLCLGLTRRMVGSRFGMMLRGAKQNEVRLRSLGVGTTRYKLMAFTIAGAMAGLAGALNANHTEFVDPGLLHWTQSGEILVMVILGGAGTLFGPVLGAMVLLFLEEGLAAVTEHWMVILGPLLVLAVLFARRGLWGLLTGPQEDKHD